MLALYISLLDTEEQISKFEHIYTKYRGLMFYTAKGVLQDSYLAEDAVHETFLDIIRIIDSIRANNEKELSQFLRVLTHHKAVDMVRKCTRQKKSDTEIEDFDLSKSDVNVETIVLDKIDYENIFNEAEIKAFFHGADSFRPHEKAPARHLVIPVFYRLLYCCGLRPAEARLLKKENVDLVRGSVYVVESKGHKDRVVAVADDLLQIMRSYSTLISEIYPDSDYFFPRYDGEGPYTKRWTEEMFWRCFSMAGITAFEGPKPRVYDFRHTFATECICRWMREGRDIDAMLPFLSAYMGHARYEDTLYYVHMVPDFYERVGTVDRTAWEKLLPEVHDEG